MGENACEHDADKSRVRVASAEVGHAIFICSAELLLWKRRGRRQRAKRAGAGKKWREQLLFDFEPDR